MTGNAKFSYQHDVERNLKRLGNRMSNRNAAARQTEYDNIRAMGVDVKLCSQQLTSLQPILERLHTRLTENECKRCALLM